MDSNVEQNSSTSIQIELHRNIKENSNQKRHRYKCGDCNELFDTIAELEQHIKKTRYHCIECCVSFAEIWQLKDHELSHAREGEEEGPLHHKCYDSNLRQENGVSGDVILPGMNTLLPISKPSSGSKRKRKASPVRYNPDPDRYNLAESRSPKTHRANLEQNLGLDQPLSQQEEEHLKDYTPGDQLEGSSNTHQFPQENFPWNLENQNQMMESSTEINYGSSFGNIQPSSNSMQSVEKKKDDLQIRYSPPDATEISFTKSERGRPKLCFRNFIFNHAKCSAADPAISFWFCEKSKSKYKCRMRIHLKDNAKVVKMCGEHNHPADEMRKQILDMCAAAKEAALISTGSTQQIIKNVYNYVPNDALPQMPNPTHLKRTLQRHRHRNSRLPTMGLPAAVCDPALPTMVSDPALQHLPSDQTLETIPSDPGMQTIPSDPALPTMVSNSALQTVASGQELVQTE